MAEVIERGMKVTIVIEDDLVGCSIKLQTEPEVDIRSEQHKKSDALILLGQFLEVVSNQTAGNNLGTIKVEKQGE